MANDIVATWIEIKKEVKELDEKLKALELLIMNEHRDDERIKVVAGRKSYVIKDETYELLERVGVETYVVERRRKELNEFDVEVQKTILNNEKNFEVKTTKESLRIK